MDFVSAQLASDYFVFVYCLCLAALQTVAALSGLRGLTILPMPWSMPLSFVSFGAGLGWFFESADRNTGGLAGSETFVLFLLGATAALATSLLASSLLWRSGSKMPPPTDGIEALRYITYWQALGLRMSIRERAENALTVGLAILVVVSTLLIYGQLITQLGDTIKPPGHHDSQSAEETI